MKNILVVEDDPANLQVFAAILWSKGHNVLEASTPQEAFEAAQRTQPIHLLVTDVGLRDDLSGTEVAAALAQKQPGLPVVFVTGTPFELWDDTDRQNIRSLPSDCLAILEKPFMPSEFEVTVEGLLQRTDAINAPDAKVPDHELATA